MNKVARIYLRVSTEQQSLKRQESIIEDVKSKGFYIAGVYSEKATGTTANRPELNRLIDDLQKGDYVVAERLDRLTRLPPKQAEELIEKIENKGARLLIPGIFYFDDILSFESNKSLPSDLLKPLLDGVQKMFLRIALQASFDDWELRQKRTKQGIKIAKDKGKYKGRKPNKELHAAIIELRKNGLSIKKTAIALNCSESTVFRVWKNRKKTEFELLEEAGQQRLLEIS